MSRTLRISRQIRLVRAHRVPGSNRTPTRRERRCGCNSRRRVNSQLGRPGGRMPREQGASHQQASGAAALGLLPDPSHRRLSCGSTGRRLIADSFASRPSHPPWL